MRIDYTLPGLDFGTPPSLPESTEIQPVRSFRDELRGPAPEARTSWRQTMGLESRPLDATFIGPPPKPRSLELGDASSERVRWRRILSQHSAELAVPSNAEGAHARQSVQMMLDMLQSIQDSEDSLVSMNASVTRG